MALAVVGAETLGAATYESITNFIPPKPRREFRGVWVTTRDNIDWPSKPGLSTARQKAELLAILDRAVRLKLNAVIFQVRPACDAMYASSIEPWSEWITGTMGQAPWPYYDPLAFAVQEAHRRGLELHAWFNPFRALLPGSKSHIAPNHISRARPDLVHRYGEDLWLDPGAPDAQIRALQVVMDVVKRYDIDGVHFDDYFYPYAIKSPSGLTLGFPDESTWRRYGSSAAARGMSRDDWRRENINAFLQRVHESVHAMKPWVLVGVSPFGIWRPGFPPQIRGKDAYAEIFADSRKWLANGWLDYCAPQLYWPIESKEQSFPALLQWWLQQNGKGLHVWPGLFSARVADHSWEPSEIINQIQITRRMESDPGHIHYNYSALTNASLAGALSRLVYTEAALMPASPWLDSEAPKRPALSAWTSRSGAQAHWKSPGGKPVRWWFVQFRSSGVWNTEVLPSGAGARSFLNAPDLISVCAVDRDGNTSLAAAVALKAAK